MGSRAEVGTLVDDEQAITGKSKLGRGRYWGSGVISLFFSAEKRRGDSPILSRSGRIFRPRRECGRAPARVSPSIHPIPSHQTICGFGDDFLFGVARAREGAAESNAKTSHHQPCPDGIGDWMEKVRQFGRDGKEVFKKAVKKLKDARYACKRILPCLGT